MSQKKAQLMVPPTAGRIGAVKAGTCITIESDGTINATVPTPAAQVFFADAGENIWSCNTSPTFTGATNNFFAGKNAGACVTGACSTGNILLGCYAGNLGSTGSTDDCFSYFCDNLMFGAGAGQFSCKGYGNFFSGASAGKVENGYGNVYLGYKAGKGSDTTHVDNYSIVSASCLPPFGPANSCALYNVGTFIPETGATVFGTMVRDGDQGCLEVSNSILVSYGADVPTGTLITIPGNQIGGTSPADDAVLSLSSSPPYNCSYHSVFLGYCAGSENYGNTYGSVAIGAYAGQHNSYNDFSNVYIGNCSGRYAVSDASFYNLFLGAYTGEVAGGESVFSNTFVGAFAGRYAGNHFYQTLVGAYAGSSITNPYGYSKLGGPANQLFGAWAASKLTSGFGNSLLGLYSGCEMTTGTYNSYFGYWTGSGLTTGSRNSAFGECSGATDYFDRRAYQNGTSTGNKNIHVGSWAGRFATGDSSLNTAVGVQANMGVNDGICAFTFGAGTALPAQANCSYVVPTSCFYTHCTGYHGYARQSGTVKVYRNGSGSVCRVQVLDPGNNHFYTTFLPIPGNLIGGVAGTDDLPITSWTPYTTTNATCNYNNTYLGAYSGQSSVNGTSNFFGGFRSGSWSCNASNTVAIGAYAGFSLSGSRNTVIGCCTGVTTTGNDNIFIGTCSGFANTSGTNNIFVGPNAGALNTTGGCNVVLGAFQGTGFTTCSQHVFISDGAGCNRLMFNNSGAMGVGGANYGTAGQVLTSCGNALAPVWTSVTSGGGGMDPVMAAMIF